MEPLGEYLATHMPARVRPPGELTAYSNYGASLAGYIVGQVSAHSTLFNYTGHPAVVLPYKLDRDGLPIGV